MIDGNIPINIKDDKSPQIESTIATTSICIEYPSFSVHNLQKQFTLKCQYLYQYFFILQYIVVKELSVSSIEEGVYMNSVATLEASDLRIIRSILRSMANEHWSVQEALDEYDIPEFLREDYEAQIEACFVD